MSWVWPPDRLQPERGVVLPGLSARLTEVGRLARTELGIADVGTDHGRLPLAMVAAGWSPVAVAIDRAAQPLNEARRRILQTRWRDRISVRQGDGLSALTPGEVDTVVIAGMGGRMAAEILSSESLVRLGIRRVVVQPNRDDVQLRTHLGRIGWPLRAESLVYDRGRIFYTAVAEAGAVRAYDLADLWMGPFLRTQKGPLVDVFRMRRLAWLSQRRDPELAPIRRALLDQPTPSTSF
ncbi:MAG: class I SAM-dependent methyltransferase [Myxococcota bacterium]